MTRSTTERVVAVLFLLLLTISGAGNSGREPLPPDLMKELSTRTHETKEEVYTFAGVGVIHIEGLRDLYVVRYQRKSEEPDQTQEGALLDFAVVDDEGKLRFLYDTHEGVGGVIPTVEGIDVLPGDAQAEIMVLRQYPPNAGERTLTVQKYLYKGTSMELVDQADLVSVGEGQTKWVKAESFDGW